jgi:hypothetical protein
MLKTATAAVAIGFALAAAATPALAKHRAMHPGYNARAEAPASEATGDTSDAKGGRTGVLQECNKEASKFLEYTWGEFQSYQRRACMAEHGQPE